MDERTPLERRLMGVLEEMAGPTPRIDAMAIAHAAQRQAMTQRRRHMFTDVRLVTAGAMLALVGGFLVANVRTPALVGTDSSTPQALLAASPSAAPGTDPCLGPITAVSGVISFGSEAPGASTYRDDAGGIHFRDWSYASTLDLDDDRLDGATAGAIDWDFQIRSGVHRGTFRVENAEGAWEGPYTGVGPSTYSWRSMTELTGEGAYAGLSAILFMSDSAAVTGTMFPTALPTCDFAPAP